MSRKKIVDEKISEALDIDFEVEESLIGVQKSSKPIVVKREGLTDTDRDYETVRRNLKELIDVGRDAIDGIIKVATEGDSPRAYEVASQMIKMVAETNKDLIDLHKTVKEINKEELTVNNTTNQSIYVGSTSELQDLINQSRSSKKLLKTKEDE
jgi:hypothetical protein